MQQKNLYPIILFLILFSFISCHRHLSDQVTILHTNDLHAQYLPIVAHWVTKKPQPLIGGMEALFDKVKKELNDKSLILDAGDFQTGSLLSHIAVYDIQGAGFIEMMNLIGYDASVCGNHDFDHGWKTCQKYFEIADFPILSANLFQNGHLFCPQGYRIFPVGSIKVGVIGLTLQDLYGLVSPSKLDQIEIKEIISTAQKTIDQIDSETGLIVLLTHQGFQEDSVLAESIYGADVIVGGHSHTYMDQPRIVNNIIIVQAGARCRYLGRLDLTVKEDKVINYRGRLIPLWVEGIEKDTTMNRLVATYKKMIDSEYGQVIGELTVNWKKSYNNKECNMGNYFTDVLRISTKSDFALLNSGAIRKEMEPGPIRIVDILEILPFENRVVTFTCSGKDLLTLCSTNGRASLFQEHDGLQVSGIMYSMEKIGESNMKIIEPTINGHPIDPKCQYTGATVDYVVIDNANKYMGFKPQELIITEQILSDVVIKYMQKLPRVSSKMEKRMLVLPPKRPVI